VVLEAWDAGAVPVVFRDSGGAAEVVAAAKGGVLYEEETPESLAQALLSVLCLEPEATARLVHNGRVWMATQCDAAVYGNTLREVLATASVRA
jgi:glycosyltransferase involved in cell wall biosynthesis